MSKTISKLIFLAMIVILSIGASSCDKNNIENKETLKKLYEMYKDGEIDECKYNGKTVYCAGLNAYDAGSAIYDKDGKLIGECNYAWGNVDPICGQLIDCKVIYRVRNNIWGEPAVDKYGLKRL
jgi:hypothetical protein